MSIVESSSQQNFASRLNVVAVSTLTKPKVSLALVSIITSLAAEKFESSSSGFMLIQNTRSPISKLCMLPAVVICLLTRLLQIAF